MKVVASDVFGGERKQERKGRKREELAAETESSGEVGFGGEAPLLVFLWGRPEPGWRREWRGRGVCDVLKRGCVSNRKKQKASGLGL